MEILSTAPAETQKLAQTLAQKVKPGMVLALFGDLGSGKTTFTAFLAQALGFTCRVQSPTFIIHRRYAKLSGASALTSNIAVMHHLDLYRLTSKAEVVDLGLSELLAEHQALVLIEWPELASDVLPANVVKLYFTTVSEATRRIVIEGLA